MFTTVCSAAVYGLQAYLVRVEVDLAGGLPSFQLVGSLGSEVKESRERVSVAMKNSGFQIRSEERRVGKECRSRWSPYH